MRPQIESTSLRMVFGFSQSFGCMNMAVARLFHLFERHLDVQVCKNPEHLKEANLARAEHQPACEHHDALVKMDAARIVKLEAALHKAALPPALATRLRLKLVADEPELPKSEQVVAYLSRPFASVSAWRRSKPFRALAPA